MKRFHSTLSPAAGFYLFILVNPVSLLLIIPSSVGSFPCGFLCVLRCFLFFNKICVYDDVSSFVCRRNGWQADDQGSLLIIAAVLLYHQPGSATKTFAHILGNEFFRALLVSSIGKMFCRTSHIEMAVHLKPILHTLSADQIIVFGILIELNDSLEVGHM